MEVTSENFLFKVSPHIIITLWAQSSIDFIIIQSGACSGAVVEALRYKPEGCRIDSRWHYWKFFIDIILRAALWPWGWLSLKQKWVPGIFPGGKVGQCIGLTTLPPSCADCLKIWEPHPPGTLRAYNGIALPLHNTIYSNLTQSV
jgi:hypothetical protein